MSFNGSKLISSKIEAAILDFGVNGALRVPLELVCEGKIKAYGLRNKSLKFHNSTQICSGTLYTLISICNYLKNR